MSNDKKISSLKDKYLDIFDNSEAKFNLFCRSLNNDLKMIKVQLKLLRKQRESETYEDFNKIPPNDTAVYDMVKATVEWFGEDIDYYQSSRKFWLKAYP